MLIFLSDFEKGIGRNIKLCLTIDESICPEVIPSYHCMHMVLLTVLSMLMVPQIV